MYSGLIPMRSRASTSRRSRLAPQRHREHPAQPREAVRVPLEERVQNRFGVAVGAEAMSALFQFAAQFQVIVDLAVEDDDGVAILGQDGLIAALHVDDLQPRRAQRDSLGLKDALLVRAAMDDARNRILDSAGRRGAASVCKAGNAAQFSKLLPSVGHFRRGRHDADVGDTWTGGRAGCATFRHWTCGMNSEVSMRS